MKRARSSPTRNQSSCCDVMPYKKKHVRDNSLSNEDNINDDNDSLDISIDEVGNSELENGRFVSLFFNEYLFCYLQLFLRNLFSGNGQCSTPPGDPNEVQSFQPY
jgi:hypothetical protein